MKYRVYREMVITYVWLVAMRGCLSANVTRVLYFQIVLCKLLLHTFNIYNSPHKCKIGKQKEEKKVSKVVTNFLTSWFKLFIY